MSTGDDYDELDRTVIQTAATCSKIVLSGVSEAVKTLDAQRRIYFFSGLLQPICVHMVAAMGEEAALACFDSAKEYIAAPSRKLDS